MLTRATNREGTDRSNGYQMVGDDANDADRSGGDERGVSDDCDAVDAVEPTGSAADRRVETVYEASDGWYYTAWQLERRLRTGEWRRILSDRTADRHLVETIDGESLFLVPIGVDSLPGWAEVRLERVGARIVDRRRSVPER
ncbi:hypothetical protein ACFQGT_11745 [Natrialbaceae archaeon GCM10025810]|uniref:hypothetical protein n=1 Tax=Halovalidus salilacus TaxID=3075124 RepID=UPI00360C7006